MFKNFFGGKDPFASFFDDEDDFFGGGMFGKQGGSNKGKDPFSMFGGDLGGSGFTQFSSSSFSGGGPGS